MDENRNFTIVDSIMGSGKTTAMINQIREHPDESYIFITPYLSEIDRVMDELPDQIFQPINWGGGKLEGLHKLLALGKNIVATHALFLKANELTIQLIKEGEYTLILDESIDVFQEYNGVVKMLDNKCVNKSDVRWLISEKYITVSEEYNVKWDGPAEEDFHFSEVKRLADQGSLRCIDNSLYWEYSPLIFEAFKKVYVLTYIFESCTLASYLSMYRIPYEKASACKFGGEYTLCSYTDSVEQRKEFSRLITIYEGKYNDVGSRANAFSVNWLNNLKQAGYTQIKNNMRRYKESVHARSGDIMWTTTKQGNIKEKLSQKGFTYIHKLSREEQRLDDKEKKKLQCFVPCTARATNDFSDRTVLMYMINRYLHPEVEKYFNRRGFPIDENAFATCELVQWIWRSAVRRGEPIQVYIPSSRMRKLLKDWLCMEA